MVKPLHNICYGHYTGKPFFTLVRIRECFCFFFNELLTIDFVRKDKCILNQAQLQVNSLFGCADNCNIYTTVCVYM